MYYIIPVVNETSALFADDGGLGCPAPAALKPAQSLYWSRPILIAHPLPTKRRNQMAIPFCTGAGSPLPQRLDHHGPGQPLLQRGIPDDGDLATGEGLFQQLAEGPQLLLPCREYLFAQLLSLPVRNP